MKEQRKWELASITAALLILLVVAFALAAVALAQSGAQPGLPLVEVR